MKETKKFLCKKRKKIFMINKCEKRTDKNNQPKNSLIGISRLVLDYIKENKHKTGNQITEYVINSLQPENDNKTIQKNIQRRVYDSINVLNALGLIKKNKQNINYTPILNKNENDKISNIKEKNINEIKNEKNNEEINLKKIEYFGKLKKLKMLQKELIRKYITLKYYEQSSNLINNQDENTTNDYFENKNFNNNKNYPEFKNKNNKISSLINIPNDIIKKKIAENILNILDINNKERKSAKIFKIMKNNINEEKQNYLKIPQNKKLLGNINEKKNEDIVFNYLKKLKIFKNELFSFT